MSPPLSDGTLALDFRADAVARGAGPWADALVRSAAVPARSAMVLVGFVAVRAGSAVVSVVWPDFDR